MERPDEARAASRRRGILIEWLSMSHGRTSGISRKGREWTSMDTYVHVLSAVGKKEDAARIAKALVDRRLAGCVQILGPIDSTYRWRGKVERAREWLLLVKTTKKAYPRVERAIEELHPYETPEILALPVVRGSKAYLRWLSEAVR